MGIDPECDIDTEKTALEHASAWFSIHATQRLQSINFFLITMAFLSAAFVTAAKEQMYIVAGGVAVLGVSISYFFYQIDRRIQSLLKAAENAIEPLQDRLASRLDIDALRIVARVEDGDDGVWKYSKSFRYLYCTMGAACILGLLYVFRGAVSATPDATTFNVAVQAMVGMFLVLGGYKMLIDIPRIRDADCLQLTTRWSLLVLAVLWNIAGLAVICHLVCARL